MTRLFAGLKIPDDLSQRFDLLKCDVPGIRWQSLENFHVTLSFIGEVDDTVAKKVEDSLHDIQADQFQLTFKGIGAFSRGDDPKVLWVGVEKEEGLVKLKEKVDVVLQAQGLSIDHKEFRPHMTLAFVNKPDKEKLGAFLQEHRNLAAAAFGVSRFVLYQSTGAGDALVYQPVATYPLL